MTCVLDSASRALALVTRISRDCAIVLRVARYRSELSLYVLSEPIKSSPSARVLAAFTEHEDELATCAVVWHELRYGCARLPESEKRRAIEAYLEEAVRPVLPILPYDGEAAAWHAVERARLARRGRQPAAADGQIAAIAHVNELILVTANVRDFRRFERLTVEDCSR